MRPRVDRIRPTGRERDARIPQVRPCHVIFGAIRCARTGRFSRVLVLGLSQRLQSAYTIGDSGLSRPRRCKTTVCTSPIRRWIQFATEQLCIQQQSFNLRVSWLCLNIDLGSLRSGVGARLRASALHSNTNATSEQVRLPAEFKHINKRRKRN